MNKMKQFSFFFSFSLQNLVMASTTITLNGNTSSLNAYFYPEIELCDKYDYSCCLLGFYSFNSIPNVNKTNNSLVYTKELVDPTFDEIILPTGSYEIDAILEFLETEFKSRDVKISIGYDKNTMRSIIYFADDFNGMVKFSHENSIGSILGFTTDQPYGPNEGTIEHKRLGSCSHHFSKKVIHIQAMNNLRIDCDLITGSYHNGTSTHTLYEFDVGVDPGYKIIEQPKHLIYLPVVRRRINTINLSILDQDGKLVDFRGENITCRIHIKKDN